MDSNDLIRSTIMFIASCSLMQAAHARADSQQSLGQVLQAVAKVESILPGTAAGDDPSTTANPTAEKGSALAIGRQGDDVYFVTADHVLFDGPMAATEAVAFVGGCASPLPIHIEARWLITTRHIAFFRVHLPDACRRLLVDVHFDIAWGEIEKVRAGVTGMPVKLLGLGDNGEIATHDNFVSTYDGKLIGFREETKHGTSGGIAVTETGQVLCIIQLKRAGSLITDAVLEANAAQVAATFLGPHALVDIKVEPTSALVSIDNAPKEIARPTYFLKPEWHDVAVEASGYEPIQGRFQFGLDGVNRVCAHMDEKVDPAWRDTRWIVFGGGTALALTGVGFGIAGLKSHGDFTDHPSHDAYVRTNTYNKVADITGGAGAMALAFFAFGHVLWNATANSTIQTCQ